MAEAKSQQEQYMYKRNFRSSIRLNYNHWVMKSLAGYLLHPSIPTLSSNIRIADCGTGTGIWSLELLPSLHPSSSITGFDISPTQFPPASSLPPAFTAVAHDCFKPFPTEYIGAFDIVHARLWLCLLNNPDAPKLLSNLLSLLKPGGYIQWLEPLPLSTRLVHGDPNVDASSVEKLVASWHKPKPTSTYEWVEGIAGLMEGEKVEVLANDKIDMPSQYQYVWAQSQLAGLDDIVEAGILSGAGASMAGIRKWMEELEEKFKEGVLINTSFTCVVGKKAV